MRIEVKITARHEDFHEAEEACRQIESMLPSARVTAYTVEQIRDTGWRGMPDKAGMVRCRDCGEWYSPLHPGQQHKCVPAVGGNC